MFMYMPLWMHVMKKMSITYHLASPRASTKGWYFSFNLLNDVGGITVLAQCDFNEI